MPIMNHRRAALWLLMVALLPACGSEVPSSSTTPAPPAETPAVAAPAADASVPVPPARSAFGDVEADGDCPVLYTSPNDEIAAQANAVVPLKAGLTLSHVWRAVQSADEIECLSHIRDIDAQAVSVTNSCLRGEAPSSFPRRTCRKDMRSSRVYQTRVGTATPETLVGATSYSLSRDAYLELKRDGATPHRYIEMKFNDGGGPFAPRGVFDVSLEGTLMLDGPATMPTIVNDAVVELPVLRLRGQVRGTAYGKPAESRLVGAVIDDERFPLVLEYRLLDLGEHEFSVRYTKISYPTEGAIEKRLAEAETVDVYGIYFDFASDTIREESEPVLKEIADALDKHPEWALSIAGHTDNIGSDTANLELSQRRSAAVRAALVERHGITAGRLVATGHGEAAPKDTNETPEGRARNRRVELTRR